MRVDQRVERVVARARIGVVAISAIDRIRFDSHRSFVAVAVGKARAFAACLAPPELVRLAGVLIVSSAVTNNVLVRWSPSIARPGASTVWGIAIAAAGLAMILLAEPLARAWTSSHVRRLLFRGPALNRQNGDPA